jgi:hypothetical protein
MPSKSPFTMSTAGVCRAAMAARFEVTGWSLGAGSGHDKCFGENDRPGRRTPPGKGPRTIPCRSNSGRPEFDPRGLFLRND